jgi:putative thioredoxin
MAKLAHVFDATRENFQRLVLDNSRKGLVLANYWTPQAPPCFKLWQELEALSAEYQGRFLLVNINTDAERRLARDNGITSVPTIKLYRDAAVVESIYGAHTRNSLREAIERHIPAPLPAEVTRAIQAYQEGRVEDALKILANAGIRDPENTTVHATMVRLLLRQGRYADLEAYVAQLPATVSAAQEIDRMLAHAQLLHLAQNAPPAAQLEARLAQDPGDPQAALQHIALAVTADDFQMALDGLLRELDNDRQPDPAFVSRLILALFALLGDQHPLTRQYRRRYLER